MGGFGGTFKNMTNTSISGQGTGTGGSALGGATGGNAFGQGGDFSGAVAAAGTGLGGNGGNVIKRPSRQSRKKNIRKKI